MFTDLPALRMCCSYKVIMDNIQDMCSLLILDEIQI